MSLDSAVLSAASTAADTGHDAGHPTGDASGHATGGETQVIFFLFGALLLGGLFKEVNKKTGIPYTPMLFILGIVCGFLYTDLGFFGESLHTISNVDPHGLLLIFLPVLIFESGFNADWHIFKKQLIQILTLAIPCVFVSAIFVAFSIKVVLGYSDEYYTWLAAFMFGAILSCTDTVAVLALLKECGASKKFNSLIEGESLINDGTCMVLLTIASEIYKGRSMPPQQIVSVFLQLTLGGVVLGVVFGIFSVIWIRKIFNDEILVVNITLISCYMVYFVAENVNLGIKISGIIALVSLGLFMAAFGRTRINAESEHAVHTFWRYAVYCAETIIFLVAGIIIGVRMLRGELEPGALPVTTTDLYKLGGLYICMTVARFLAISVFMPILKRYGYGLTWKEVGVLTYGGLRGAIGISFALIVARDTAYEATLRHFILFDMAGCAFLTLVINGTTTGYFVKKAGLAGASPIKQRVFLGYLSQFLQQIKSYQEELKAQPYLSAVDWTKVSDLVGITKLESLLNSEVNKLAIIDKTYKKPPPFGVQTDGQGPKKSSRAGSKAKQSDNDLNQELLQKDEAGKFSVSEKWSDSQFGDDADDKLIIECRNRFLMALKGEYYHLFAMSQCGPDAFIILKESTDWDLDKEAYPMTSWDHLSSHFMNPTYIDALFYLKSIPIVGRYAKNALFNHLSYVYDASLNYVSAHEAVESIAESFPFEEDILRVVLQEASENRAMAESYVYDYLNVTFPEINKSIQMKKAAYNILNREKEYLEETSHQGQLDDKEFKVLKKIVDTLTYSLGETNEPWELAPGNEFLKKSVFFSSFTEDELKEIDASSELTYFKKDAFITKEGQPADYLYVIHKGVATETNNATHFKEKKTVGAVISYHLIISTANRYHTSVVAESIVHALKINLATVKKLVRRHKEIEEFLWRESFYFMTRLYSSDLVMFEPLDRATIPQILGQFTFKRYKPQETIDFTKGGIFLKGNAYGVPGKKPGQSLKADYEDEEGTQGPEITKYHTMTYFPPSPTKVTLKAEKHCWAFHFNNYEKIVDLVNSGAADREKKRSLSMASFRRGSQKIPIKVHKADIIHERDEAPEAETHLERSPSKLDKKKLDIIDENENL